MLPINSTLLERFKEFSRRMQGRNPEEMLNELLKSGRVTQAQVDQARKLAEQFRNILK